MTADQEDVRVKLERLLKSLEHWRRHNKLRTMYSGTVGYTATELARKSEPESRG
jgi:hypothetical protein